MSKLLGRSLTTPQSNPASSAFYDFPRWVMQLPSWIATILHYTFTETPVDRAETQIRPEFTLAMGERKKKLGLTKLTGSAHL
jgi:hypothetical protein